MGNLLKMQGKSYFSRLMSAIPRIICLLHKVKLPTLGELGYNGGNLLSQIKVTAMPLSADRKKQFRTIGHTLNPIVTIAGNGLSEGVRTELSRALDDHELIKVKLAIAERDDRKALVAELEKLPQVEIVQAIGKVVLLYKPNKKANPKLSNLHRN